VSGKHRAYSESLISNHLVTLLKPLNRLYRFGTVD